MLIDVAGPVRANRDYLVSIDDIIDWGKANGPIPGRSIVPFRTEFGSLWPNAERYLGTSLRGVDGVAALSFPGLSAEAATWLIENRRINAVVIDTASIDFGKSRVFAAHVALMTHNVPVFENLANLQQLPATGIHVVALPIKIRGGSGGPLRIIATMNDSVR